MGMTPPTDERFYIELLKLLLHVAWSDDELNPRDAQVHFAEEEMLGQLREMMGMPPA